MTDNHKMMMTEVAAVSGFNSLSSFNRYFIKIKGISPSEYLNANKKIK